MQCDIDILGEPSNLAEIELILATTTTLGKLGFKNFQIRINERRILKAMAAYSGFEEKDALMQFFKTIDSKRFTVLITEFANRPNNPPIPVFILKQI